MAAGIVCGVDGSTNADEAAIVARRLSERLALRLEHVHVGRDEQPGELGSLPRLADAPVRRLEGPPARCLVAAAHGATLLVIGTRGHGVMRPGLAGSVADAVIRAAGAPVLVVPPGAGDRPLEGDSLVCAVKDAHDAGCAATAAELAAWLDKSLVLAHAIHPARPPDLALGGIPVAAPPPADDRTRVHATLGAVARAAGVAGPGRSAARIVEGPPGPKLVELARSERSALLATGAPSHGALMSALLGSPSRHLVRHAPCPVLVWRPGAPGAAGLGRLASARWVRA